LLTADGSETLIRGKIWGKTFVRKVARSISLLRIRS